MEIKTIETIVIPTKTIYRIYFLAFYFLLGMLTSCQPKVREEDKIFHAGPVHSGFGVIYFGLYKGNKYQFCDGDFMDPGCYTGYYSLSGDTVTLLDLKQHDGVPTNRFLIRRYHSLDSSYWQWKYPEEKGSWRGMRDKDTSAGSSGDIFPLETTGEIVHDKANYFLIRLDVIENYR